ncbi:glycoside hydrolase family 5 protein [Macrolepiota fuliginosa MF-IS2]|uniref:Glycoside hydrolase family 5 protein n=1 Tax=Macrolepiota fuliginosa MF-IS2 TaxID=1400762 RepID=A0A9P5XQT6_9AGAR|nr:glycoside hydrolase family 5 protein [Macrolepiota fuliginosa MF-IS2]
MYNLSAVLAVLQLSQSLVNPSPGALNDADSPYKAVGQSVVKAALKGHAEGCHVEPYNVLVENPAFPPFDQTKANVYRYRQQQGVNLGSWFVHEQWMTPSLFRCAKEPKVAEIDIAGGWGGLVNARAVLEKHWDEFITAEVFNYLASIGINTVRIPIGHFTLPAEFVTGTPFEPYIEVYKNAWPRLLRAISQAGEAGIGVLIDMHGAPGSQNGQPHSGVSDGQTNFFKTWEYQGKTIEALRFLVQQLGPITNVIGIQLLNEPAGDPSLEDFYTRATDAIRQVSFHSNGLPVYIHDAFDLYRFGPYINRRQDFVVHDHHSYFVFTDNDSKMPANQHATNIRGGIADAFKSAALGERRNLVIGEWSCALTKDSLGSQADKVQAQRDFCTAQMQMYSSVAAGWYFWSWDNEQCEYDIGWCFKHAIGTALPPTFFAYSRITSLTQVQDGAAKVGKLDQLSDDQIASVLDQSSRIGEIGREGFGGNGGGTQHRFGTIHERQSRSQNQTSPQDQNQPGFGGGGGGAPGNLTANNKNGWTGSRMTSTSAKGFRDGYRTATVFATYGMSKLGFTEQYMSDAIARAGPEGVPSGMEGGYRVGFMLGLVYGEQKVLAAIGGVDRT